MKEFLERLSSRKWLLTLAVCGYFVSQGEPAFPSLTQVVIAFLAIEGGADALARVTEARITGKSSSLSYGYGDSEIDIISTENHEVNEPVKTKKQKKIQGFLPVDH